MEKSLFSKYHIIHGDIYMSEKSKSKLMKIYRLYSSSRKLWTKKNFDKLHKIADKYLKQN